MNILLIAIYIASCILTFWGYGFLGGSSSNPSRRNKGLKIVFTGFLIRFVTLFIAWMQSLHLLYAIFGQFLPLLLLIGISYLEKIKENKNLLL